MTRGPNVGHAVLVARTELRRTWRNLTDSRRGLLLLAVGALILPLYGLGLGAGAFFLGRALTTGSFDLGRAIVSTSLAGLTGLVLATVLQRTIKQIGEPDAADGLLTTVAYQDVLAGLLLAEYGRVSAAIALPVLGIVAGFALGTGSPLVGVVVFVLVAALTAVGLEAGYLFGLVAKYVAGRSAFVARHRAGIGVVVSIAVPVLYLTLSAVPAVQRAALRFTDVTPFALYADVVFLVVPGVTRRPLLAAGGIASLLVGLSVFTAAIGVLAERVWYMDRVEPDHEFDPDATTLSDRLLSGRVSRQTQVVAQKSWRRARRAPFTVQFAVFPFFLLVFQLQAALLEWTVPPSLPLLAALASAMAGGAAFTLNPLGGEGDVLPTTLTATVSGRQFVAGLALAGGLPGAVLAVALSVPLGVAAGLDPLAIAFAALTGVVVAVGAPAIASGVGVVFPRFETTALRSHEVVVPSTWAFAGYILGLGVAIVPVVLTQHPVLVAITGDFVPFAGTVQMVLGLVLTTGLLAVLGTVSGGFAIRKVATYRLD